MFIFNYLWEVYITLSMEDLQVLNHRPIKILMFYNTLSKEKMEIVILLPKLAEWMLVQSCQFSPHPAHLRCLKILDTHPNGTRLQWNELLQKKFRKRNEKKKKMKNRKKGRAEKWFKNRKGSRGPRGKGLCKATKVRKNIGFSSLVEIQVMVRIFIKN